ncbi:MAG TPA: glycosyltransferase family 2 protein [Pseudomonadales bacterium]|nr:glycosyltransferase family 2 protein [Pseudomonadales bacterium]
MKPLADIIVPVFNERENLPDFLARLRALKQFPAWRLTIIDNASTDGSVEYLREQRDVNLVEHRKNEGYGASLREGIAITEAEHIVIIDADCEYPPEAIPQLLQVLQESNVVYASRFLQKHNADHAGMPFFKWLGNRMISGLFNVLFDQKTTDLYTGCKAMRRQCLRNVKLHRDGFEHVLELAVQLSQRGYHIAEIPVDFSPRRAGVSKMSHAGETLKYLFWLLVFRVQGFWSAAPGKSA